MTADNMYTTRRDFLVGGVKLLSASSTLPLFLGHTALALADPQGRKRKDDSNPILVVVQLAGGNDGLNTVVPYENDLYYQARRQIAIAKDDVLPLAQGLGLNPAAEGLKTLYDAGRLAIVQGVGYPNPNRSHFVSMDVWHTADPNLRKHDGWLGRYFDATCKGDDPGPAPINGIALATESPLAMQGEDFAPLAFSNADDLTWKPGRRNRKAAAAFDKLNNRTGELPEGETAAADYLRRAALDALVGADQIRSAAGTSKIGSTRGRGGDLGRQLTVVARMIRADLPTRVYYVSLGGFDTHSGQVNRQRQLLSQLSAALSDFVATLEKNKLLDRVLVMSFSEFGRRVQQNSSGGTDHGEAGPMFIVGTGIKPGLHGKHPSLSQLHRGDLAYHTDFRRVYADVLRNWMELTPREVSKVLGRGFGAVEVVRG